MTIVEQLPKIGGQLESITKKVLLSKLKEKGVRVMTGHKLTKVEDNGVLVVANDGKELFIEGESVIILNPLELASFR